MCIHVMSVVEQKLQLLGFRKLLNPINLQLSMKCAGPTSEDTPKRTKPS